MKNRSILLVSKNDLFSYGVRGMLDTTFERNSTFVINQMNDFVGFTKVIFSDNIDLVVVDLMCGEETTCNELEIIINKHPKVKFLVMMGIDNWTVVRRVFDMEVSAVVGNAVKASDLRNIIRKTINGEKYYDTILTNAIIDRNRGVQINDENMELLSQLSKREKEILKLIAREMTNREIAERLFISKRTVDTHRQNIINKLNVKNTAGLIKKAMNINLL